MCVYKFIKMGRAGDEISLALFFLRFFDKIFGDLQNTIYLCGVYSSLNIFSMKKRGHITATILTMGLLSSCFEQAADNEAAIESGKQTQLKVTTRATQGEVSYPVQIYAYDAVGNLAGQQTITADGQNINLQLGAGRYHLTAISGESAYIAPKNHDIQSAQISIPANGYAEQALMLGGADVTLGDTPAEANLILTYRVAQLNLSLSDVPQDVTGVTVSVGTQYAAIDMGGMLSGKSTTTLTCQKVSDVWQSPTAYLLPGAGQTTTLTLTLARAEGQTSYSYELGEALESAVPYRIEGHYVESTAPYITGVLTVEGWQQERTLTFDFGNGSQGGGSQGVTTPTVKVDALPAQGQAWNGHVVALVENATATEADLLLWSLTEYDNVYAPIAEGHENDMQALVNAYEENGLQGWSVPTADQARELRKEYGGKFDDLNAVIEMLGGNLITVSTASNNARYLCEEGTKTFNFAESGSITSAGKSVKYRLRLLKVIHAIVAE